MFQATFGGQPVESSRTALEFLQARQLPTPPDFQRCNSLFVPLGPESARGWLLMRRSSVEAIDLTAAQDLEFVLINETANSSQESLLFRSLVVCDQPQRLIPTAAYSGDDLYLVRVADQSYLCGAGNAHWGGAINNQYNIRADAYGGATTATDQYLAGSLNAGSLWTWQTLVTSLWAATGLAGSSTLPFTPDGIPEGFAFPGQSAWQALSAVLLRLGCAVSRNLTATPALQYSIVRIGSGVVPSVTTHYMIHDADYLGTAPMPAAVTVYFNRQEKWGGFAETTIRTTSNWQTQAVYGVSVTGASLGVTGTLGGVATLWDDSPAIYDESGALTNSAALATRAAERVADYYRMLRDGGHRLWQVFSGLVPITTGAFVKGVAWRETPGDGPLSGITTEIVTHPYYLFRVGDQGSWEPGLGASQDSSSLRPPDLGPSTPTFPITDRSIRVTDTATTDDLYPAYVQRYDPVANTYNDREQIWAVEMNGVDPIDSTGRYPGRLVGYANDRPVWEFNSASGGGGGGATVDHPIPVAAYTTELPAYTRTGNDYEANANGAAGSIGGVLAVVGQKILLNEDGTFSPIVGSTNNGVLTWTSVGSGGSKFTLSRASEMNADDDLFLGKTVIVQSGELAGDEAAGTLWALQDCGTITGTLTLNTTPLLFHKIGQHIPHDVVFPVATVGVTLGGTLAPTTGSVILGPAMAMLNQNALTQSTVGTTGDESIIPLTTLRGRVHLEETTFTITTANANAVPLPDASVIGVTYGTASLAVNGIRQGMTGLPLKFAETKILRNDGTLTGVLKHENASASASERIMTTTGGDLSHSPGTLILTHYSPTFNRTVAAPFGGSSGSLTGSGNTNYVAYWSSSTNITYDVDFRANSNAVMIGYQLQLGIEASLSEPSLGGNTYGMTLTDDKEPIINLNSGQLQYFSSISVNTEFANAARLLLFRNNDLGYEEDKVILHDSSTTYADFLTGSGANIHLRFGEMSLFYVTSDGGAVHHIAGGHPSFIDLPELDSNPGSPDSGYLRLFAKTDHKLYIKSSSGTVTDLTA